MMGKKNKSFQQKKWNEKLVSKTLLALSWNVPIKLLEHHPESTWTFFHYILGKNRRSSSAERRWRRARVQFCKQSFYLLTQSIIQNTLSRENFNFSKVIQTHLKVLKGETTFPISSRFSVSKPKFCIQHWLQEIGIYTWTELVMATLPVPSDPLIKTGSNFCCFYLKELREGS